MDIPFLYNEKLLVTRLTKGDKDAFEQIYHAYSMRLFGNLLKLSGSEEIAQELLQEVFIKIWENRATIDPEKSFRSYLFKVATNKVYDFFRKAARDKTLQSVIMQAATDQYLHVEEKLLEKENSYILQSAITALPQQRRTVFTLCRIEGKSYEEVSQLLGISTSTISDHIVKANRFIKNYVQSDHQLATGILLFSFLTSF